MYILRAGYAYNTSISFIVSKKKKSLILRKPRKAVLF